MHWRQVDVVCERASGIPCVCLVLLECGLRVGGNAELVYVACFFFKSFTACTPSTCFNFSMPPLYTKVGCYLTAKLDISPQNLILNLNHFFIHFLPVYVNVVQYSS